MCVHTQIILFMLLVPLLMLLLLLLLVLLLLLLLLLMMMMHVRIRTRAPCGMICNASTLGKRSCGLQVWVLTGELKCPSARCQPALA